MALSPGVKLGPYQIPSALGAGGMGEFYRAGDTRLGRTIAVKIFSAELSPGVRGNQGLIVRAGELRVRFEREARSLSSLNHRHICQLYDICVHGRRCSPRPEAGRHAQFCRRQAAGFRLSQAIASIRGSAKGARVGLQQF
jgi:serine/threonine protein kinase